MREWLGLMAVSNIIEVDPSGEKFFLPNHRRSILTGPSSAATSAEAIARYAQVHRDLMSCMTVNGPTGKSSQFVAKINFKCQ